MDSNTSWLVITNILIAVMILIAGVVGYLFNKKEDGQDARIKTMEETHQLDISNIERRHQEDISELRKKHEDDVNRLVNLELLIAGHHYNRVDIDALFNLIRTTIKDGFAGVFDAIAEVKKDVKETRK
jgi:hypothetical protein